MFSVKRAGPVSTGLYLGGFCLTGGFVVMIAALQASKADDFGTSFHQSCVSSVVASVEKNGVKADAAFQKKANDYCNCAQTHIQGQFTASELLAVAGPTPDPAIVDRMKPIMLQCQQETFKQ